MVQSIVRPRPIAVALSLCASALPAQSIVRANVSSSGVEANAEWDAERSPLDLSADGRCVAFVSAASNLVPSDTNGVDDAFVRDLATGTTERVSVSSSGQQSVGDRYGRGCFDVAISGDGRYVAFSSAAGRLIDGDKSSGRAYVYVRDRVAGSTERVSVTTSGGAPNDYCWYSSISGDGRYVAFCSPASNLVANDRNRSYDVFVRDRWTGTTVRASVDSAGREGNSLSALWRNRALSADGRYLVFGSTATNLVPGDTNGKPDGFVRDLVAGTTQRVTLTLSGGQLETSGWALSSTAISGDGRFVSYLSTIEEQLPLGSPRVDPDDPTSGYFPQAMLYDRVAHATACVSLAPNGEPADAGAGIITTSADGRYLAFASRSSNLVASYSGGLFGVFVRDQVTGLTIHVSPGLGGSAPDGDAHANLVMLDANAAAVAFASHATNLVPGDSNGLRDVFVAR